MRSLKVVLSDGRKQSWADGEAKNYRFEDGRLLVVLTDARCRIFAPGVWEYIEVTQDA